MKGVILIVNVNTKGPNEKEKNYCQKGHQDDLIVRTLLKKELVNDKTEYVVDLDKDGFFRVCDIDLILFNKNNKLATAEVKADGFPAIRGNKKYVFLELISNSKKYQESDQKDGLGCILTSRAHYFIFYFILYDYYLIINSQKLRQFIKENKDKYEKKQARTFSPDNRQIWYYSEGILVPVSDLIQIGGIVKKSRYKYLDIKRELNIN